MLCPATWVLTLVAGVVGVNEFRREGKDLAVFPRRQPVHGFDRKAAGVNGRESSPGPFDVLDQFWREQLARLA